MGATHNFFQYSENPFFFLLLFKEFAISCSLAWDFCPLGDSIIQMMQYPWRILISFIKHEQQQVHLFACGRWWFLGNEKKDYLPLPHQAHWTRAKLWQGLETAFYIYISSLHPRDQLLFWVYVKQSNHTPRGGICFLLPLHVSLGHWIYLCSPWF